MVVYRYATLFREPGPGAVPRDGLIDCGYTKGKTPSGRDCWGWVEYNRKLTEDEVSHYELEYVIEIDIKNFVV